jgi:ABC-2 type transport system ATP-binding protein
MSRRHDVVLSDVTKRYGETDALSNLELRVPRGTVYGFLGPNGAGKTTTMRVLATLTSPTTGEVEVAGYSLDQSAAIRGAIGYLPDTPPVYEELTGREQLRHIARLRDIPADQTEERLQQLSERFKIREALDDRIANYSTGMRQKLGITQTLLHDPAVVLLDEPTSGLDPGATDRVKEAVTELAADDVTVFFSSHVLSIVEELADQVGVLSEGELVDEGTPSSLVDRVEEDETLEDAFFTATSSQSH